MTLQPSDYVKGIYGSYYVEKDLDVGSFVSEVASIVSKQAAKHENKNAVFVIYARDKTNPPHDFDENKALQLLQSHYNIWCLCVFNKTDNTRIYEFEWHPPLPHPPWVDRVLAAVDALKTAIEYSPNTESSQPVQQARTHFDDSKNKTN